MYSIQSIVIILAKVVEEEMIANNKNYLVIVREFIQIFEIYVGDLYCGM